MEENRSGINWNEVKCLAGCLSLQLPEEFREPTEDVIGQKFPYKIKPQEIHIDVALNRILTLNLLGKTLEENQIYDAVREMQRTISHVYPESVYIPARETQCPVGVAGWFSFITGGIVKDQHHIMFIISFSGRMMLASYHFPAGNEQEELQIFMHILSSLQIAE